MQQIRSETASATGSLRIDQAASRPEAGPAESIFQQTWWAEAAAGPCLEYATVLWDGRTVASMPFIRARRAGFTLLEMPPYTRTLGPVLRLPPSKPAKRLRNMHDAVRDLIHALPKHDRCQAMLEPDDPAAFSLALAGCSLGQNFTFRMPAVWEEEQHWLDLDQKTRNLIRSASKALEVRQHADFEVLLQLSERERGSEDRSDLHTLRRLVAATAQRNQITTLSAHQEGGRAVAAAAVIWDSKTLFFWQSVRDSGVTRSGATSLLVWEAMLLARRMGLVFDIDGYHSLAAARFVSRFGMQAKPRTSVLHLSRRGRIVQAAGRLIGRGGGFGVQPIGDILQGT